MNNGFLGPLITAISQTTLISLSKPCRLAKRTCFILAFMLTSSTACYAEGASLNLKNADIYSLIETCKASNVNTYNYLRYLFENIHKAQNKEELRAILPYNIDASDLAES